MDLGVVLRATSWLYFHVSPSLQASYDRSVNVSGVFESFSVGFGGTATVGVSL